MADCFIKRRKEKRIFDYTGITAFFDINSVDINNKKWHNTLKEDYMTLYDSCSLILDGKKNTVQIAGGYGVYTTDFPMTIYVMFRGIKVGDAWAGFIGKGLSTNGQQNDYHIYSDAQYSNANAKVYMRDTNTGMLVLDPNYHVYCLTNKSAYVDGVLLNNNNPRPTGVYNGKMYLNMLYRTSWASGKGTTNYKMIAFGQTEHNADQVLNNSRYLLRAYS
jgi:hypothetical protein